MTNNEKKAEAQKEFCRINGLPNFAGRGGCHSCGKNVYESMTLKECSSDLITGCPYCQYSFCS